MKMEIITFALHVTLLLEYSGQDKVLSRNMSVCVNASATPWGQGRGVSNIKTVEQHASPASS